MKMSKEIVDARRKLIMQRIQTHGSVDVNTLANELNVTPLTIRRDLQYWEDLTIMKPINMPSLNMPLILWKKAILSLLTLLQLHY